MALPSEKNPYYIRQLSSEGPDEYPKLLGETDLTLEVNTLYFADDRDMEHDDWLVNNLNHLIFKMTPGFSLEAKPYLVADGFDDGFRDYNGDYSKEGIYFKLLKLEYDTPEFSLFGGRYEPADRIFGYAPIFFGNYTTNLDLYGRIGIGGAVKVGMGESGNFRLTAHRFMLDTSRLSGELISENARNTLSDGGVGNSGKLNNYLFTLDVTGESSFLIKYTLGFGKQEQGRFGDRDEIIDFSAIFGAIPLEIGGSFEWSVDYLSLRNAGGYAEDNHSITYGIGYSDWPFFLGLAYSRRVISPHDLDDAHQIDNTVEVVYRHGVTDLSYIEGSYWRLKENNLEENAIGVALIYSFDWLVY